MGDYAPARTERFRPARLLGEGCWTLIDSMRAEGWFLADSKPGHARYDDGTVEYGVWFHFVR